MGIFITARDIDMKNDMNSLQSFLIYYITCPTLPCLILANIFHNKAV